MNRPKIPPIKSIKANGLADAYYKLVKTCLNEGAYKKRLYGKPVNTLDIVSLTEIKRPLLEPMLHPDFPTKQGHLTGYEKQRGRDYDWKKQGFEYNYMNRLTTYPNAEQSMDGYYNKSPTWWIDQLKVIREKIAKRISEGGECLVSNRDQAITWIPDRDLFVNEDQPCLQRIQFFVYEYPETSDDLVEVKSCYSSSDFEYELIKGKAEFHVSWRSRDLFSAWNSDMIGLTKMLDKEIFEPNNLDLIRVVDFCNSLYIYESDWESAKNVKPIAINP